MTHELITQDESGEVAVIEATARQAFDAACYEAQATWHNTNEILHRAFQDGCEDNNLVYRQALTKAQRQYRDATADTYR